MTKSSSCRVPRGAATYEDGACELAIGCFAAICTDRLGEHLVSFSQAWPSVSVGIHELTRAGLISGLRAGDITLAVLPGQPDPRFSSRLLWQDRVVALVARDHPLAGLAGLASTDLGELRFLVSRRDHGADLHSFLTSRISNDLRLPADMRDGDTTQLLDLVAAGAGAALACESQAIGRDDVAVLPVRAPLAHFTVFATWCEDRMTPALKALITRLAT